MCIRDRARAASWARCWRKMVFKDLPGYPMWEQQLHDVLAPHFGALQSIFVHYCGAGIIGAESIASATRVGLMEVLQLAKDTGLCTRYLNEDDVSRQFTIANHQSALDKSGSSERHHRPAGGAQSASPRKAGKPKWYDPIAEAIAARQKRDTPPQDLQLNLFEFINFLVRVAFWRCNPCLLYTSPSPRDS